jgi:hypothetical protein
MWKLVAVSGAVALAALACSGGGGDSEDIWTDELVEQRTTECIGADESDIIQVACHCLIEEVRADHGDEVALMLTDDLSYDGWFELFLPRMVTCLGE